MAIDPLLIEQFRTQDVYNPEDLWQPLYDRVNYPATGTAQLAFFSQQKGASVTMIRNGVVTTGVVKSYNHTNMEQSGVVPSKLFKVIGISCAYIHLTEGTGTNAADRDKIRGSGVLHFKAGDKDLLWLPLHKVPEQNPFVATSGVTCLAQAGGGGAGNPMYRVGLPYILEPYQSFSLTLDFDGSPTITNAVDIYISLESYMRRPT